MTRPSVAAIVLAAGGSTRLGRPKQLLPVDGRPLLSRTLDVVRASSLEPRIVVLGGYDDEIRTNVRLDDFAVVENQRYQDGQATSLQAGIQALPDSVDAAAVILGDQPLVPPWLLDELVDAFDPASAVAVRPRYSDGPGNPVLLSRELFPELLALEGDIGARDVISRYPDRIVMLDHTGRPSPRDVDTLDDYHEFLRDWAASGAPFVPRYCQQCGAEVGFAVAYDRLRPQCAACGFLYLLDPKVAVAVVVDIAGQIVMHQRTIGPGTGRWTFPSGFVDRGEVVVDAARREVAEEVGLEVSDLHLFDVWSETGSSVILLVYQATATGTPKVSDDESSAVGLFDPRHLPDLAFARDEDIVRAWINRHPS